MRNMKRYEKPHGHGETLKDTTQESNGRGGIASSSMRHVEHHHVGMGKDKIQSDHRHDCMVNEANKEDMKRGNNFGNIVFDKKNTSGNWSGKNEY